LIIGRRTRSEPGCFSHVIEAEGFFTKSDWPAVGDPGVCSDDSKVQQVGLTATGYIYEQYTTWTTTDLGRFRVYGRAYTDDIVNTKIRVGYVFGGITGGDYTWTKWQYVQTVSQWCWLDFGSIYLDPALPPGIDPFAVYLRIQYEKDLADTVALDFILLLPEDESIVEIGPHFQVDSNAWRVVFDQTKDFEYVARDLNVGRDFIRYAIKKGDLQFKPIIENRLIMIYLEMTNGYWPISEYLELSVQYLPQFVSPLE